VTGRVRRVDCVRRGRSLSNSAATGWGDDLGSWHIGVGVGHATFRPVGRWLSDEHESPGENSCRASGGGAR
jgi:hypothetical protein